MLAHTVSFLVAAHRSNAAFESLYPNVLYLIISKKRGGYKELLTNLTKQSECGGAGDAEPPAYIVASAQYTNGHFVRLYIY